MHRHRSDFSLLPLPIGRGQRTLRTPGEGPPENSAREIVAGSGRALLSALIILAAVCCDGTASYQQQSAQRVTALAYFGWLGVQPAQAQSPPSAALCPPGLQCVTLTVDSANAGAPPKLTRDDVQLFGGNKQITIEYFAQEPASIGILVDTSGSMIGKLLQAREAITEFVNGLNGQDDLFLFAFSSQPFLLQPFTTDHKAVVQRLLVLFSAQGQTTLYDSLVKGLLMVRHGRYARKALLVITDGFDNASWNTKGGTLKYAQQFNVAIYSIGFGLPNRMVDMETLGELADATRAKTYNVRLPGEGDELKKDVAAIAAAIGNRYDIGFLLKNTAIDSLHFEIRNHPGATFRIEGAPIKVVNVADTPAQH